jgi:ribosomal protein S18 acetylase RimI-like enzyme
MAPPGPTLTLRPAAPGDERALASLDRRAWSWRVAPVPLWPESRPFFDAGTRPEDVLTAWEGGRLAGYVKLRQGPLPTSARVQEIHGMAVEPGLQGRGVGRRLLAAAIDEALRRGAEKLVLRVLGTNTTALALYRAAGFVEEERLRGQFLLEGHRVDDVVMALRLEHPAETGPAPRDPR